MTRVRAKRLVWAAIELAVLARGRWKSRELIARGHGHGMHAGPFCVLCTELQPYEDLARGCATRADRLALEAAAAGKAAPSPPTFIPPNGKPN